MTGGRHTAVCLLGHQFVNDWQKVSEGAPASAVSRYMTASAAAVKTATPLSELAQAVVNANVHRLIVVDDQHRPIGTVSRLDVLAALARAIRSPTRAASA
jgi:predicted transcriptional regulator